MKRKLVLIITLILIVLVGFLLSSPYVRLDRFGDIDTEWVDFVQVDGVMYHLHLISKESETEKVVIDKSHVGKMLGKVKFRLTDNVHGDYKVRDWDAGYLERGTKVYSLLNENDKSSVVVEIDGIYYMYSAVTVNY